MRIEAEVEERRGLIWPLSAVGLCGGLLAFVALQPAVSAMTFLVSAAIVTSLSFVALLRSAPKRIAGMRRVNADGRGLLVDGELVMPRQSILHARVKDAKPNEDGLTTVVIEPRGLASTHLVRVHSARIAQALADTLEQEPSDLTRFDALPPWAHRMRWLAIILTTSPWILFNLLRHLPGFTIFIVLGLYALIALPMLVPQKVSIGEDGVLLRWAGRRRFLSFSSIRAVRTTPLGIEIDLASEDEPVVEIRLTHRAEAETQRRNAMHDRIEKGIAAHQALEPIEDEALLARGSRSIDEWMQQMAMLGAGDAAGYRVMAIPRERLWAVLENPGAAASAREGAALALHARLDDAERERLEAIAEKSASPRLRIALDAVVTRGAADPKLRVALLDAMDEADEIEELSASSVASRKSD